jgi:regulator of replication initiation timing
VSQAGTVQNALSEESLEGFRAAIQSLQEENKHLRIDLAQFREENRQLRAETQRMATLFSANAGRNLAS